MHDDLPSRRARGSPDVIAETALNGPAAASRVLPWAIA